MKRGYLTVYLSLTLTIIMSFIFSMVEGARYSAIRLMIETATDMGIDSVFSEYHRELLSQYDLFFIDTSYGEEYGSVYKTTDHLKDYMSCHLKPETGEYFQFLYKDFYDLDVNDIEVEEAAFATDDSGYVLKRQAVDYMKEYYGISYINLIKEQMKTVTDKKLDSGDIEKDISDSISKIKKKYKHKKKNKDVDERPDESKFIEYTDIFDGIRHRGILNLVVSNPSYISNQSVNLSQYVSHRQLNLGCGLTEDLSAPDQITDEILFNEYLLQKCGYYTKPKPGSLLKYQMEYLYAGKNSDIDNLRYMANVLLQIRAASNLLYLEKDKTKQTEVEAIAIIICVLLTLPDKAVKIIAFFLTLLWAYAEAIVDIRTLFDGGKVPLLKDGSSFSLSLSGLGKALGNHKANNKEGLTYDGYLRILVGLMNPNTKLMRCMDIIEMDIRQTIGNEHFRLDQCIDYIKVQIGLISGYGPEFLIEKKYRYF